MRGLAKFTAGIACGCVLAGGVATAADAMRSGANYPAVHVTCAMSSKQLNCFTVRDDGIPVKNGTGVAIDRKTVYVFKRGKAVYSTPR